LLLVEVAFLNAFVTVFRSEFDVGLNGF
jgi:hypothetical protein